MNLILQYYGPATELVLIVPLGYASMNEIADIGPIEGLYAC